MLPVDFRRVRGRSRATLAWSPLIVDKSAAAAIRDLHPAKDEAANGIDILRLRHRESGMTGGKLEGGAHLPLCLALADQTAVAPRAQREGKCIEQNRFAGAGLAGQNGESGRNRIEFVDQNDIADESETSMESRGP